MASTYMMRRRSHGPQRYICFLMENRGLVLTRDTLMSKIWGLAAERENRTLDVHIRTLRAKLGYAGNAIETVRGVGYRFVEAEK